MNQRKQELLVRKSYIYYTRCSFLYKYALLLIAFKLQKLKIWYYVFDSTDT